jgi:hypothetical protein
VLFLAFPSLVQAEIQESHYIDNTLWKLFPYSALVGFSGGVIYVCDEEGRFCSPAADAFYTDFIFFALLYLPLEDDYPGLIFGFLPSYRNVGRVVIYNYPLIYALRARLLKVSDNWIPEE